MNTAGFLETLRARDIQIWPEDGQLRCSAPAGTLSTELHEQLRQRKAEILKFLHAADSLARSAEHYRKALSRKQAALSEEQAESLRALNRQLIESERKLTSDDGLPRRPWYKHLLDAPGVYSGYDAKTVPGVREGIEQKRYAEAEQEIARVAKALEEESALIESAAQQLEQTGR